MSFDLSEPAGVAEITPRFCPECRRPADDSAALCPYCGATRVDQGYCGICDAHWRLPVGAHCPKHDLPLDTLPPRAKPRFDDGDPIDWTTVAGFPHTLAAEAARIRLEAEGIPTFLENERMGDNSLYQVATGGVRLQVPRRLEQDARILLSQSWDVPADDEDDLDDAWDELAPEPGAHRRAWGKVLVLGLLLAPLALALVQWCWARLLGQ